jgi:uncharacterized protein involved in response to NO
MNELCRNPYKLFFALASLCLSYGCLTWVRASLLDASIDAVNLHTQIFMGGFLTFAIWGFLLTALPRFSQTDYLKPSELMAFIIFSISMLLSFIFNHEGFFWLSVFLSWLQLLRFGVERFKKRQQNPPHTFILVGLGLLMGVVGSFLFLFEEDHFDVWAKLFYFDGLVLAMVLGVGGRLIAGILGHTEIVLEQRNQYENNAHFFKSIPIALKLIALFFVISFIFEGFELTRIAYFIRAIIISYMGIYYWRIHKLLQTKKWQARMTKLAGWFLLVAIWLQLIFFEYAIHVRHLIYIGCYCLLTVMVASRVVVAHSELSLEIESRKWPYLVIGILISLAALTRASAILMPQTYLNHLGYAAIVLLLASLLWPLFMLPIMFGLKFKPFTN